MFLNEDEKCFSFSSSSFPPKECLLYFTWKPNSMYRIKENVYKNNMELYKSAAAISASKELISRRLNENYISLDESDSFAKSKLEPQGPFNKEEKGGFNNEYSDKEKEEEQKEDEQNEEEQKEELQKEEEQLLSLSKAYQAVVRALAPLRLNLINQGRRETKKVQQDKENNNTLSVPSLVNTTAPFSAINTSKTNKNKSNNKIISTNNNNSNRAIPYSNGLECVDNPMVEQFGTKCRLIARSFGDKLGCNKKLIDLSPDGYLPDGIPQFSRVADACPESCGLCEECAPGCALWFIGNTMCDAACNNAACQFDGGDCWSADCVVSEWTEWSECTVTCGPHGVEKRTRSVKLKQKLGGKACPKLEEIRNDCNSDIRCPIDCLVGEWSAWSSCSATCGMGHSERTREVLKHPDVNGGKECPELKQTLSCFLDTCDVDCLVTEWKEWSECSKTCGGGAQTRRRDIYLPPTSKGNQCPSLEESRECNTFSCDYGCDVSEWSEWSDCDLECGGGKQSRERQIKTKGLEEADCPPLLQEVSCNTHECAYDCKVSEWNEWSECSNSCNEGYSSRNREVLTEKSGVGEECPDLEQSRKCFLQPCGDECIVNEWSKWSECSASCGKGLKRRFRDVIKYPQGSEGCPTLTEVKECVNDCGLQCVIAEWSTWSSCEDVCSAQNSFSPFQDANNIFAVRTKSILLYTPSCPDLSTLVETQPCSQLSIVCDVNCIMSDWGPWSNCSEECGGGSRSRRRSIIREASGSGQPCGEQSQTQPCGTEPCLSGEAVVDCKVSEWNNWSDCDASCGGGRQVATREILAYPQNGGASCPNTEKFMVGCNNHPCAEDCIVTQWTTWSSCTATCGGGTIERTRTPIRIAANGGKHCPELVERSTCASYPCPIDCEMGEWGVWSECNASCDVGVKTRSRQIKIPSSHDPPGLACGPLKDTAFCVGEAGGCTKDCKISEWTEWSECSATCGLGYMFKTREVLELPVNGGVLCPNDLQVFQDCNMQPCEIDCKVSEWSEWSECSITCVDDLLQSGTRIRTRSVIKSAKKGGAECPDLTDVDLNCNSHIPCPTDCEYDTWSDWGPCNATCGMGKMKRERGIIKYAKNGGKQCDQLELVVNCLANVPCVIDCIVSEWSDWSECTATCGGGSMRRSREVDVSPANSGKSCPPLDEYEECNTHSCGGVNCEVSNWSDWTKCTKECGGGIHFRKREVQTPSSGSGEECPDLEELKGCNMHRCQGVPCEDNDDVPRIAKVSCKLLAAQGCGKTLLSLAQENNIELPRNIPPETRIKDACPASCNVCKECAPGCQLRDLGNGSCDEKCLNDACQNDLGDCGGDCPLPTLPPGVVADPNAVNLSIGQSIILSCESENNNVRFKDFVSLRQIALSCIEGNTVKIYPEGINIKQIDKDDSKTLEIPPCVEDPCPFVYVSNFSEEYNQFNGVYVRGDGVRGYPRYIQLGTDKIYHLWLYAFNEDRNNVGAKKNAKMNKFAWLITTYNPSKSNAKFLEEKRKNVRSVLKEDDDEGNLNFEDDYAKSSNYEGHNVRIINESNVEGGDEVHFSGSSENDLNIFDISAAGTGKGCITPEVGSDAPFHCADKWIVGVINEGKGGSNVTAELTDIKIDCIMEEEKQQILDQLRSGNSALVEDKDPPETFVGGQFFAKCEDRPEVEQLSKKKCTDLKKILGCDFLLKDTGVTLPNYIPFDSSVSSVCPETCGLCQECSFRCPRWFLGNNYCDETCNNEACEFDGGDCLQEKREADITSVGGNQTAGASEETNYQDVETPNKRPPHQMNRVLPGDAKIPSDVYSDDDVLDSSTSCNDSPMVANMGYSCAVLLKVANQAGKDGCNAKLIDLATDQKLPATVPVTTRVKDACPKTCKFCKEKDRLIQPNISGGKADITKKKENINICKDNSLLEEKSGYTCAQIKGFVNDDCSRLLVDIAGNADMMENIDKKTTLADACPKTCGVCTDNIVSNKDCEDNPIVQQYSNMSCEQIVDIVGCDVYLKDVYSGPLPDGVPEQAKVRDACIKACNACPDSVDTSTENECYDDPRVSRMGYTCQLFLQFAREGCDSKINDLLGGSYNSESNILPEGISADTYIKHLCRLSCGICKRPNKLYTIDAGGKAIRNKNKIEGCADNPIVAKMGFSCSLLIQYSVKGCNSPLQDLSNDPLPLSIRPNTLVKDACMDSCGLCNQVVTCDDGFQNGDEEGIDCGGSCRPCLSCSSFQLKAMAGGRGVVNKLKIDAVESGSPYVFEGSGLKHNDVRTVKCKEGYERKTGKEGEVIACLDGTWKEPSLKCVEKNVEVQMSSITFLNAYYFGPESVSSIYSALESCLLINPPDELRILYVGSGKLEENNSKQDEEIGNNSCVDSPLVEQMGYSCEMLRSFCDKNLKALASTQGASLPDGIPEEATVKDACPVTCNICVSVESKQRLLIGNDSASVKRYKGAGNGSDDLLQVVVFAFVIKNQNIPLEKRFTDDIEERFSKQLNNQLVSKNVNIYAKNRTTNKDMEGKSTVDVLRKSPITVSFKPPENRKLRLSKWSKSYSNASKESSPENIFHYAGIPNPSKQKMLFYSDKQPFGSNNNKYIPNVSVNYGEAVVDSEEKMSRKSKSSGFLQVSIFPGIVNLSGVCTPLSAKRDVNGCCQLEIEFKLLLDGECGSLLYDNSLQKNNIKQFCVGIDGESNNNDSTCFQKFSKLIDKYVDRAGNACELVQFAQSVLDMWCSKDSLGNYCFASVEKTLKSLSLQSLVTKSSKELDVVCNVSSCYRKHVTYLDSMTQLQAGWYLSSNIMRNSINDKFVENRDRRILQEGESESRGKVSNSERASHSFNNGGGRETSTFSTKAKNFGYIDFGDVELKEGLNSHLHAWIGTLRDSTAQAKTMFASIAKSLGILNFNEFENESDFAQEKEAEKTAYSKRTSQSSSKITIKEANLRRLSTLNNIVGPLGDSGEDILNLVCTRVEGDYCQQTLLLLIEDSPVKNPTLVVQPCARRCFVPITGQLGTLVESYGVKYVDPFSEILGKIMRGYGRFYCQQNEYGKFCGEHIFNKIKIIKSPPYNPEGLSLAMPECKCQHSFLQDGECDSECFSAACGWDGEDCLLQRMFPEIYIALTSFVDENCLFYKTNFECTNKCRAQYDTARNLEKQGCCFTSALEVLGGLLETEEKHPLVNSSNQWRSNRNIAYLEQTCVATFDRTCSKGMTRKIIKNELHIDNIQSDVFMRNVDILEKIKKILRTSVTQKLGLVDADMNRIVARRIRNGLAFEYDIDCGNQAERVQYLLQNANFMKQLEKMTSRRLSELDIKRFTKNKKNFIRFLFDLSSLRFVSVSSFPLQFETPPMLPHVGTLGMSDLQINMLYENCTLKDMFLIGKGYNPFTLSNDTTTFAHGTTRIVKCASSYDPVFGPNPDKLECNNGKWILQNFLECRKGCTQLPIHDIINYINSFNNNDISAEQRTTLQNRDITSNVSIITHSNAIDLNDYIGKQYKVIGSGFKHGSYRKIECEKGYAPYKGISPSILTCNDGVWDEFKLICKRICSPFKEMSSSFIVKGEGNTHKSRRVIYCANGYYPKSIHPVVAEKNLNSEKNSNRISNASGSIGVFTHNNVMGLKTSLNTYVECLDGAWTTLLIDCVKPETSESDSNQSGIARVFNQLFSGPGILGALIFFIIIIVISFSIFIAWKLYFRKKAKKNLEDRENTVEKLKRSKINDYLHGKGDAVNSKMNFGSKVENKNNVSGDGFNGRYNCAIEDETTNWANGVTLGSERKPLVSASGAIRSIVVGDESIHSVNSERGERQSSGRRHDGNSRCSKSICDSASVFSPEGVEDMLQLVDCEEQASQFPTLSTLLGAPKTCNNNNVMSMVVTGGAGVNGLLPPASNLSFRTQPVILRSNSFYSNDGNEKIINRKKNLHGKSLVSEHCRNKLFLTRNAVGDDLGDEECNHVELFRRAIANSINDDDKVEEKVEQHEILPAYQDSKMFYQRRKEGDIIQCSTLPKRNYDGSIMSESKRKTNVPFISFDKNNLRDISPIYPPRQKNNSNNKCSTSSKKALQELKETEPENHLENNVQVHELSNLQSITYQDHCDTWASEEGIIDDYAVEDTQNKEAIEVGRQMIEVDYTPNNIDCVPKDIQITTAMTPVRRIGDLEGGEGSDTNELSPIRYATNSITMRTYAALEEKLCRKNRKKKCNVKQM